jgi:hypothetical protein
MLRRPLSTLRRRRDRHYRIPALDRLAEDFARLEAAEHGAEALAKRPLRLARLGAGGAAIAAIVAGIVIAVLSIHSASASDVRRSAAAAEEAGTFRFTSISNLTFSNGSGERAQQTGAVDLNAPGYRVRITARPGATGFERIVLPHTLYVRHVGGRRPAPWREIMLSPAVAIAAKVGAGEGIADPLGLLAVLRESHGAQNIGQQTLGGVATMRFRLRTTLGPFLRTEGISAPAEIARDPVNVEVWLDSASRVIRAQRLFYLRGRRDARLSITTNFSDYGADVGLQPTAAPIRTGNVERLNPVAADPLTATVLAALLNGSRHPATPTVERRAS